MLAEWLFLLGIGVFGIVGAVLLLDAWGAYGLGGPDEPGEPRLSCRDQETAE